MTDEQLQRLVLAYLDGRLGGPPLRQLERCLAESPAARQTFWSIVHTRQAIEVCLQQDFARDHAHDASLDDAMAELLDYEQQIAPELPLRQLSEQQFQAMARADEPEPCRAPAEPMPTDPRPQKLLEIGPLRVTRRSRPAGAHRGFGGGRLAWAAGIAAMLVMTVLLMQKPEHVGQPVVDAARVTDAVGAEWVVRDAEGRELEAGVGDGLVAGGMLEVERGFVELEMANETRVIVEGPSEIELEREALVRMERGRLVARTNGMGETFTVVTPSASITDLGTEFGVSVDDDGRTESSVFEGRARLIGLGGSLPRVQVEAGHTSSVMRGEQPVVRASDERDAWRFVRNMAEAEHRLAGYRVVDDFQKDEGYVYRDTMREGGAYTIADERLVVRTGDRTVASVFREDAEGVLEVGSIWAVDTTFKDIKGAPNAYFVISQHPYTPTIDTDRSFEVPTADAAGFRIRRTTHGGPNRNREVIRVEQGGQLEARREVPDPDPSGKLTLIVHRQEADVFRFYAYSNERDELLFLDEFTDERLADNVNLHVGFEAYSREGESEVIFENLRQYYQIPGDS